MSDIVVLRTNQTILIQGVVLTGLKKAPSQLRLLAVG